MQVIFEFVMLLDNSADFIYTKLRTETLKEKIADIKGTLFVLRNRSGF